MARPFTYLTTRVVKEVIYVSENRLRWLYYGDHVFSLFCSLSGFFNFPATLSVALTLSEMVKHTYIKCFPAGVVIFHYR